MVPGDVIKRFRVKDGDKFRLANYNPGDTFDLDIKKDLAQPPSTHSSGNQRVGILLLHHLIRLRCTHPGAAVLCFTVLYAWLGGVNLVSAENPEGNRVVGPRESTRRSDRARKARRGLNSVRMQPATPPSALLGNP
jgi:hypothetical protein